MPTEHKVVTYTCDICNTEYNSKEEAENCERTPVEEEKYKVEDSVQVTKMVYCPRSREYVTPSGVVVGSSCVPGYDGKPHLREYIVLFTCPKCGDTGGSPFLAVDLKPQE